MGRKNTGILIFALLTTNAWAQTSLIVNGSFEDGPYPGSYTNLPAGTTEVRGWVLTGEGIAQTFATKPGTRYKVTFDMAGNPLAPPAIKPMRVSAAGQEKGFLFDITGKNQIEMGWRSESWTFTANAAATTLEFRSLTVSPLTGWGPAIDNVSVTEEAVPPPLQVTETEKEIQINLEAAVLFDTGKYDLKPAATSALTQLALLLEKHPGLPISIEGHTDSVGRPEANQVLSENRRVEIKLQKAQPATSAPGNRQ